VVSNKLNKVLALVVLLGALQGCAALVVGGGVGAASAVHDRRTFGTQIDDKTLATRIRVKLRESENVKEFAHVEVDVFNGVALLVGQAPNDTLKREAQTAAESVKNIAKLHNQIRIGPPTAITTRTNDVWIANKIRANLIANKNIDGLHIKVVVEDSEVFLMGLVSSSEANIAVDVARNTKGVIKVVKVFELQS
jgi:osmotically-inducible protein OsmY